MAISKFTDYYSAHNLSDELIAVMHYDVYADNYDANADPYIIISNCMIRTQPYKYVSPQLQNKLPITLSVKIDCPEETTTEPTVSGNTDEDENQGTDPNSQSDDPGNIDDPDDIDEPGDDGEQSGEDDPQAQPQDDPVEPDTPEEPIDLWPTVYTYTINGSVSFHQGEIFDLDYNLEADTYYYINYTMPTPIMIPKDGKAFTINLKFRMRGDTEDVVFTVHSFGPMANRMIGSTSVVTGTPAIYQFEREIECSGNINNRKNGDKFLVSGMSYYFKYESSHRCGGYTDEYTNSSYLNGTATQIGFVPTRPSYVQPGEVSNNKYHDNWVDVRYFGHSSDIFTPGPRHAIWLYDPYSKDTPFNYEHNVYITTFKFDITVTARLEVDQNLEPDFISFQYNMYGANPIGLHISHFGFGVQNMSNYITRLDYNFKYGDAAAVSDLIVHDYKNGELYHGPFVGHNTERTNHVWFDYDGGITTMPIEDVAIVYEIKTIYGFTLTYVDTITVKPYFLPEITTHNARRCIAVESGSGDGYYDYDGTTYHVDDNGDNVLIEWGVSIAPLEGLNFKRFWIYEPRQGEPTQWSPGWTVRRDIPLQTYSDSGYYVVPADTEKSYDIVFHVSDYFRPDTFDVSYTVPLNTIVSAIDFKKGGTGLAFGKVSEYDHVMDVHRNWSVHMPYDTLVMNYDQNGNAKRLYDWIGTVNQRLKGIADGKDVAIFAEVNGDWGKLYDNNSIITIPQGYGEVDYPVQYYGIYYTGSGSNVTQAMVIGDNITIQRNYLKMFLYGRSWGSDSYDTWTGTRPYVYIMGTKPTTINQQTGVPDGTILKSYEIGGRVMTVGSAAGNDGYTLMEIYAGAGGGTIYIDTSSLKGRNAWIVVTLRNTEANQSGFYQYQGDMYMYTALVIQTDNRL